MLCLFNTSHINEESNKWRKVHFPFCLYYFMFPMTVISVVVQKKHKREALVVLCLTRSAVWCLWGPGWQSHWTEIPYWQPSLHPGWHVCQWATGPARWWAAPPPMADKEEYTMYNKTCHLILNWIQVQFLKSRFIQIYSKTHSAMLKIHPHTNTHLLLIDMAGRKVDIHSIFVIHDPPDPGHRCVKQTLSLVQRPLLLCIGQGTWVRQEVHICHLKVSYTWEQHTVAALKFLNTFSLSGT